MTAIAIVFFACAFAGHGAGSRVYAVCRDGYHLVERLPLAEIRADWKYGILRPNRPRIAVICPIALII